MAETTAKVKTHEALALELAVQPGATLPQCITAAMGAARRLGCVVTFAFGEGKNVATVRVSQDDTYQGVQRRVGRQGKAGR